MRSSVNIRKGGGSILESISTGRQQLTSFQTAMERYQQTARWISPAIDDAGKLLIDEAGSLIANDKQIGWNIYGIRLPGQELRMNLPESYSQKELDLLGVSSKDEVLQKFRKYDIAAEEAFDIYTLDIETTGLVSSSQVREVSLLKRSAKVDVNGNIQWLDKDGNFVATAVDPQMVKTYQFKTTAMDAAKALHEGESIPLSELAFRQQNITPDQIIGDWLDNTAGRSRSGTKGYIYGSYGQRCWRKRK